MTLRMMEALKPGSVLAEGDASARARQRKYSDELRERAVHVFESKDPIAQVARDLRSHKEALRVGPAGQGRHRAASVNLLSTDQREELKQPAEEDLRARAGERDLNTTRRSISAQELDPTRQR